MTGSVIDPRLLSYYHALQQDQPSLHNLVIAHDKHKGRYLRTTSAFDAGTQLFSEQAAVAVSDDPSVCLVCHTRHVNSKKELVSCAASKQLYSRLSVEAFWQLADKHHYTGTRVTAVIKYIGMMMQQQQRGSIIAQPPAAAPPSSLAASFSVPAPPPSFSFALAADGDNEQMGTQQPASVSTTTSSSAIAADSEPTAPSLSSLSLLSVLSLDAGPPSVIASHHSFGEEVWRLLPLTHRRVLSVAQLTQLLSILELNSHEMVNAEDSVKGEGVFPFFAMIEHSCKENCAFTALSVPPHNPSSLQQQQPPSTPVVTVTCIRPIAADSSLSINYAPPYLPTHIRRSYLYNNYHFRCTCSLCCGDEPDKTRAFICPNPQCTGIVYAYGETDDKRSSPQQLPVNVKQWRCSNTQCWHILTVNDINVYVSAENWLNTEVEKLMLQAEAEEEEENASTSSKHKAPTKAEIAKQMDRLAALSKYVMQNNKQDEQPLIPAQPTQTQQMETQTAEQERKESKETDEEEESQPDAEQENEISSALASIVITSTAPGPSLPSPSSSTKSKNQKRRLKQKQTALLTRLSQHDLNTNLLSVLHPSHHHCHTIMEVLCDHYHEVEPMCVLALLLCTQRVHNVMRVCGTVHWAVALEYSRLASFYELQDKYLSYARLCYERCYDINRQCFGEAAMATHYAHQMMLDLASH